ncbi:DUF2252 domain-containing protein [Actinocorallia longicatena]|uniref:DUF2252 domain-containing protein n=1 Tax=Actinocorallia longicatena TaxID=111803 RepID=A0ABP6QG92_9ACTN
MTGTPREEYETGKLLRRAVPRSSHAAWSPPGNRRNPVLTVLAQDERRLPDLVPLRHRRMAASPFAFLCGAAAVMAGDLASTPSTGLGVQACGDAHVMNFGFYASPGRSLVFDLNDFDETLPGPWEWDLKRLAASLAVAARDQGFGDEDARDLARRAAAAYRLRMRELAAMPDLAVFSTVTRGDEVIEQIMKRGLRDRPKNLDQTHRRDRLPAVGTLTATVDGRLRIVEDPPLLVRDGTESTEDLVKHSLAEYSRSLREDVAELLSRYRFVDAARKVVGVGGVGTRCYVVVLQGRDAHDPLVLQIKEATRSVLEPHLYSSAYRNQGRRVVVGQRLLQSASDVFLGWSADGPGNYYWRRLRDLKSDIDPTTMNPYGLTLYAELCARTLAVGHANTGRRMRIAGYLGTSTVFDEAIAEFAMAYADQTGRDHKIFTTVS